MQKNKPLQVPISFFCLLFTGHVKIQAPQQKCNDNAQHKRYPRGRVLVFYFCDATYNSKNTFSQNDYSERSKTLYQCSRSGKYFTVFFQFSNDLTGTSERRRYIQY